MSQNSEMTAEDVYSARIKELENALADALKQNSITLGQEAAKLIAAMTNAVVGNENSVKVTLSGARCPYCDYVSATMEEATEHDASCEKHPAVIRAQKAEEQGKMLVEALEEIKTDIEDCDECRCGEVLEMARAALARVKEEVC